MLHRRQFLLASTAALAFSHLLAGTRLAAAAETVPPELPAPQDLPLYDLDATFTFGAIFDISSWDPHKAGSIRDNELLFPVYDRLVHLLPDGTYRPALARSWEYAADARSIDFHLRPDVKFHDGEPFDAAAVKGNIERGKTLATSTVKGDLATIESVEIIDPLTVRFHLVQPNSLIPSIMSERAGAMISPKAFDDPDLTTRPVGAGMFKLSSYFRGANASYERWDGYWNPDVVKLKKLEVMIIQEDQARTNALLSGAIQAAYISTTEIENVKGAGLNVNVSPSFEVAWFHYNVAMPPLDNLKVRQAVQHALDRQTIVDVVEFGSGKPTWQLVNPSSGVFDAELTGYYPYDPPKAKQLLEESGVKTLDLDVIYYQGNDWSLRLAQTIQSQLNAVGFNMTIRTVDRAVAAEALYGKKTAIGMTASHAGFPQTINTLQLVTYSSGRQNAGKTPIGRVDEYLDKTMAATSLEEQTRWAREANREAVKMAHQAPLYNSVSPLASGSNVLGLVKSGPYRTEFYNVGVAKS